MFNYKIGAVPQSIYFKYYNLYNVIVFNTSLINLLYGDIKKQAQDIPASAFSLLNLRLAV